MSVNREAIKSYSKQLLDRFDEELVLKALKSQFLSRGPLIEKFEVKIGKKINNENVLTTNSATSALQLAYQLLGVNKGSLIWTSPITFVATANAARHLGAKVDFVDINPETINLCPESLNEKLEKCRNSNELPDVLTLVHFAGSPCDLQAIKNLSRKYNFKIIEDASHALGATYKKSPIGENIFSDASIFSFHPVKMITTGEGGALALNSPGSLRKALSLRSHGIDTSKKLDSPDWYYEQTDIGYNFRISEIQAALGISQLTKLTKFINIRNKLAKLYRELLGNTPLKFQKVLPECRSSYHLFTIEIVDNSFERDNLYKFLKEKKIGCQVHYIPVHLQPYYRKFGFSKGMFFNAEKYFRNCLSIPLHQGLQIEDVQFISKQLKHFFNR